MACSVVLSASRILVSLCVAMAATVRKKLFAFKVCQFKLKAGTRVSLLLLRRRQCLSQQEQVHVALY